MNLQEIIIALSSCAAPAGFEEEAANLASRFLDPFADEIYRDVAGNLIALKRCGLPGASKLVMTAHMDEIGMIITGQEGGMLRFETLGGTDTRALPASEIKILGKEPVSGVVCTLPPHVLSANEADKALSAEMLYIDTGFSEEKLVELVPPGTAAVYAGDTKLIGDSGICGKALDNRACMAIIIKVFEELAELKPELDLFALMTVQEELGRRGAKTGVFGIDPDCVIVLDTTFGRTPDSQKEKTLELGGGPAIGVGSNMDREFSARLISLAKEKKIPYQIEVLPGDSGTDAFAIQTSGRGVQTALISLPIKYMHSPAELMEMSDALRCGELLKEFVMDFAKEGRS